MTHRIGRGGGTARLVLPRIYPRQLGLALMILMTAQAFYFFPGMNLPSEFWNVLNFVFLCFIYTAWKAKAGERVAGFEFYVVIMMVMMVLWPALAALRIFGQPLFYGILARRTAILGTGALALLTFHRLRWITSDDIKSALVMLAWLTLVVYFGYMIVTHNREEMAASGGQVRLNYIFIEIGFLYYGLIGFNRKSKLHYLLAAPFLIYVMLTGKRALLLTMVGSYGLFILLRGSFSRLVVFVPGAVMGFVALVGVMYITDPTYVTDLGYRITEAFAVVTTGQKTQDVSANIRLEETAVAIPYIQNSWLMGNGDISTRWNGGYNGVLNAYFYPTDIGIFGVVFVYGVIGFALFLLQFWFAWKFSRAVVQGVDTPPMVDAVMAYLVAYAVLSLSTGAFVFNFQVGMVMIAFLYCYKEELRERLVGPRRKLRYNSADLQGLQNSS